ncbi:hypothetical protein NC653_023838 [Populus alba x Populus x berolinensis]|uniref:Uncharacterized protein n=1 Tax=Populus alba x Populus x berolinensis TaxID=444605 RepID=A0AAD6MJR2_9ROSI|nr:hypothetical protein NC653_023838 [Populus alba x Populus x berolinensis]
MELHGMHVTLLHQLTITRWFLLKYLAIVSVRFFCSSVEIFLSAVLFLLYAIRQEMQYS